MLKRYIILFAFLSFGIAESKKQKLETSLDDSSLGHECPSSMARDSCANKTSEQRCLVAKNKNRTEIECRLFGIGDACPRYKFNECPMDVACVIESFDPLKCAAGSSVGTSCTCPCGYEACMVTSDLYFDFRCEPIKIGDNCSKLTKNVDKEGCVKNLSCVVNSIVDGRIKCAQ